MLARVALAGLALAIAVPLRSVASPLEIPLAAGPAGPLVEGRQPEDYARLVRTLAATLAGKLGLPVPPYTVEIYWQQTEFEQALVTSAKLSPETARNVAPFAKAVVSNRRVLVNESAIAKDPWPERVLGLAHELVHASQLELAGQRSLVRYQWLIEGFAELTAYRVCDALGLISLDGAGAQIVGKVRAASTGAGLAPLRDLDSLDQWAAERRKRGFDASYPYAYLAVDFLIQRHSYERMLEFFRQRRKSSDPAANFQAAFDEDLAQFQAALDVHLARILRATRP